MPSEGRWALCLHCTALKYGSFTSVTSRDVWRLNVYATVTRLDICVVQQAVLMIVMQGIACDTWRDAASDQCCEGRIAGESRSTECQCCPSRHCSQQGWTYEVCFLFSLLHHYVSARLLYSCVMWHVNTLCICEYQEPKLNYLLLVKVFMQWCDYS